MDTRNDSLPKCLPCFLTLIACFCMVSPALSLDCVDYRDYVRILADQRVDGLGTDVVLRDDIAYVCTNRSLKIMDVSDPEVPVELSEVGHTGSRMISLYGDLAYLSYSDDYQTSHSGFQIVDIEDPAAPVLLGSIETFPVILAASARIGDHLLISSTTGLRVYDVTDSSAPYLVTEFPSIDPFVDIETSGDIAYLAGEDLQVIDISAPTAPVWVATLPTTYDNTGMDIAGDLLLLVSRAYSGDSELLIYNLSTPSAPMVLGSLLMAGGPPVWINQDVRVKDDTAFVASYAGLRLIDIADPAGPALLGRMSLGSMQWPTGVDIQGDKLCLSAYDDTYNASTSQFTVVNVTEPGFVPVVGDDVDYTAEAMVLDGDVAYLAAQADGIVAMDILDPENPVVLSELGTIGQARDLALAQHYAYVVAGADGLHIVDVADPNNLITVGSLTFTGEAWTIALDYPVAYIGMESGELAAVDINDPASPALLDEINLAWDHNDIAIYGDHLYFATDYQYIEIVDISDPSALASAGAIGLSDLDSIDELLVVGEVLFAGFHWSYDDIFGSSVKAYDLSAPTSPVFLDAYSLDGPHVRDLEVDGSTLYILAAGVQVVDVTDVSDMRFSGMLTESPRAMAMAEDRLVMVGSNGSTSESLLSAPLHCTGVTGIEEPGLESPAYARLSAYPNPFNPKTSIRFEQATTGPAHLAVFGLDGRLVRTLVSNELPAGGYERQWDGLDDRGHPQSSGVYLVHFRGTGVTAREKLVLLR
ncbi:MAG: T9SS type A sorting domain-containing protein [bacterium]|nr:T9SS type A sorting domain-containing protein [bacterium]